MSDDFPQLSEPTLGRALLALARRRPPGDRQRPASVICRKDQPDEVYSLAQLLALSNSYAQAYRARLGRSGGKLVCVCLYHGIHLHAAFIGGLLAGHIPAMVAPPSPRMERDKYIGSFRQMIAHMHPDLLVAEGSVVEALDALSAGDLPAERRLDAERLAVPSTLPELDPGDLEISPAAETDVALLQHSSGTTGLQKGVALAHRAILEQVRSYAAAIELNDQDVVASWLPLYHDMGLIACFILPLVTGTPIVQISQFEWVNHPWLLPQKARRHAATLCWLPNFAYSFMAAAIRDGQLADADFRSIRAFINCSEPVMAASHRAFAERFATYGVDFGKLTTCYAMAENVFAVTQSPAGRAPRVDRIERQAFERAHRCIPTDDPSAAAIEQVSNGPPIAGVDIRIVDAQGGPCEERRVGEICIRGSSLFSGYFRRDDLTAVAIRDGWYHTGDLGYLADGELYVTGRMKDLIIIQGRNFYPADIEAEAAEIAGLIPGRAVAFGERCEATGTESLILIAETEETDPAVQGRIKLELRRRIAQAFDCTVGAAHLVPPRWLIKSTAGKVARGDNRRKYEAQLKG